MTTLFSRYMFRQAANAFLVILLTLSAVVWLATALKELDLITSRGQGMWLFFQMTLLSLPSLVALIAPNALLMAALYTLDRMNNDSELIVMTAAGAPIWRIGGPSDARAGGPPVRGILSPGRETAIAPTASLGSAAFV